ncbi:12S rRNA N(4)-cytidine methyltransferase METTL15-like [Diadema antillarum]|uniref:12S rRNA N(4)-cytidine methyltransferase METTL15-like n=1 Tax=Diadema antillarum TaxID=105358 RepID=UPI003A8A47BC
MPSVTNLIQRLGFITRLSKCAVPIQTARSSLLETSGDGIHASRAWRRSLHGRGSGRGKLRGAVANKRDFPEGEDEEDDTTMPDAGLYSSGDADRLHTPVMLQDVMSFFAPQGNETYLDMTFGGGGHTQALLESAPGVKVHALDRDPAAHEIALEMSQHYEGRLQPMLGRFSELPELLSAGGIEGSSFDGVLIDAGCSSFQLDTPGRGFSLSRDGPLDMRMDGDRFPEQPTAADVVNSVDLSTLVNILRTYGEEPSAQKIAQAIVDYRTSFQPFSSTQELATVVACTFTHRAARGSHDKLGRPSHTATRTFQALRIFVNNELNELAVGLEVARDALKPGGKLAVLSFHSLEDRVVKRSLQGRDVAEKGTSLRQKRMAGKGSSAEEGCGSGWRMVKKKVLLPTEEEVETNPRARSAKLRTAIKI